MRFADVVGHQPIKEHLIQLARENKVPHALLILNRPGSGGLPMAMAFATYLVCQNPGKEDSCGACSACHKADKLIHPDIHFCYPVVKGKNMNRPPLSSDYAEKWRETVPSNPYLSEYEWIKTITDENSQGNITSTEAREIIRQLHLKSFAGGYKIQIIWVAEALKETGNILLKLIEEPPGNTLILLITENQEAILPTIISRTQIIQLPALSDEDVAVALMRHYALNHQQAKEISYIANGNYRKAQQLASGEMEGFGEELKNWMTYCLRGPSADLVKWTEKCHDNGREYIKKFLEYAVNIFREALVSKYTSGSMQPHVAPSEVPVVQALKKYISHDNLYELIPLLEEKAYHIERNVSAKIALMDLSIRMRKMLKG